MKHLKNFSTFLFILVVSTDCFPQENQTQKETVLTTQAVQAYREKNYSKALELYQQSNNITPTFTTKYNIAICYYKLKKWEDAYQLFKALNIIDPKNERVHLNLALASKRLGKTQESLEHFEYLSSFAESDAIAALAYRNYKVINEDRAPGESRIKTDRWLLAAAIGLGSDDNVITITDEAASTESDTFIEGTLSAGWYSSADFDNSWYFDSSYYSSQYSDASEYDVDVLAIGAKKYFSINNRHRWHLGAKIDQSTIGGDDYLRSIYFTIGTRYKIAKNETLQLQLRYQDSDSRNEIYNGLAGNSLRFSSEYKKKVGRNRWRLRYRLDQDDKNDGGGDETLSGDTSFISYSANRHSLYGDWQYTAANWSAKLYLNYRTSNYQDAHLFTDDTGGFRKDKRTRVGAQFSYDVSKNWAIEMDLANTNNSSSLETYEYDQNAVVFTLSWQN